MTAQDADGEWALRSRKQVPRTRKEGGSHRRQGATPRVPALGRAGSGAAEDSAPLCSAPPCPWQASGCASQAAVGRIWSGAGWTRCRPPRPSRPPRSSCGGVAGRGVRRALPVSPFPTAGSVRGWAGRRRMEAGLSAIPFYLSSASSPVAATTMDREPVGRAGEGEAVAASGAAAAAAFKESAPQVGGGVRPGEPSLLSASSTGCSFGLPGLPPSGRVSGFLTVSPFVLRDRARGTGRRPHSPTHCPPPSPAGGSAADSGGRGLPGPQLQLLVSEREKEGVSPKGHP